MNKKSGAKKIGKGLAGAIAIASGTSAYASIIQVFPPPDSMEFPGLTTSVSWDVNSDGTNDFLFTNRYPNTAPGDYGVIWQLNMNPFGATASTNGLLSYDGQFIRYAHGVTAYALIGPSRTGFSTQTQVALGSKYSYGPQGSFYYGGFAADLGPTGPDYESVAPGTFSFVGFRFNAADGTHYGWIRLSANAGIIDFHTAAYESTPNAPIPTAFLDPLVPEPGTMALLALGAVGVIGTVAKRRLHLSRVTNKTWERP